VHRNRHQHGQRQQRTADLSKGTITGWDTPSKPLTVAVHYHGLSSKHRTRIYELKGTDLGLFRWTLAALSGWTIHGRASRGLPGG